MTTRGPGRNGVADEQSAAPCAVPAPVSRSRGAESVVSTPADGPAHATSPDGAAEARQRRVARDVFASALPAIESYVDILTSRGVEWGLLGPREPGRIWGRHVLNSVALESLLPQGSTVMDVGSGAGLPGVPLAVLRPDLQVTLVESLERRASFLRLAVDELGLGGRVQVVRGRAEEMRTSVDVVTCRAVAPLPRLLEWTSSLFLPDGQLVALKGERAQTEVDDAAKLLRRRGLAGGVAAVRAHPDAELTHAVVVRASR